MDDNNNTCAYQKCEKTISSEERIQRVFFVIVLMTVAVFLMRPLVVLDLLTRGSLYETNGFSNDASRLYRRAIFLDKTNEDAWCQLAEAYQNKGQSERMQSTFSKALSVNPQNLLALANLGMNAIIKKDFPAAIDFFEKVRRLRPPDKNNWSWRRTLYYKSSLSILAVCYRRTGQPDKTRIINEEILRYFPSANSRNKKG